MEKVMYKNDSGMYLIKVTEDRYYYGNGKTVNVFGGSANQFLRFNPYMKYVGDKEIKIPESIEEHIHG